MSSIFPQNQSVINNITINRGTPQYGRAPIFDFEAGEFRMVDGKVYVGEGVEVLKNWIEKTLRTERYRFPVYSFHYGVTLEEFIAKDIPYPLLVNELKSQISEALILDRRIKNVGGFRFTREKDFLCIEFEVTTFDKKTVSMEVKV